MNPSIGRIVHYVTNNQHHAAIVTRVLSDTVVDVVYFRTGVTMHPSASHVKFDGTGTTENTWHWPERA